MGRSFNTSGPCEPNFDYMIPAAARLPKACALIEKQKYFVLHAPRQTGKTTTIRALASGLTASGKHAAVAFSCQAAGAARNDFGLVQRRMLGQIQRQAETLPPELKPPAGWQDFPDDDLLTDALTAWAEYCPLPLVLFFDELDSLQDESLITVLSQLRTGFNDRRTGRFPSSVILCGMRDVRDYKVASGGNTGTMGSPSPFNIKVDSLRLGNFTSEEVAQLYGQHTADTGQEFTPEGIDYVYEQTGGQPWLVNALAREVIEEMEVPASEAIGPRRLEAAKERLIKARPTHLDSLAGRLYEPRVKPYIQALVLGGTPPPSDTVYDDDLSYLIDLGLLEHTPPDQPRVSNPIYKEVILRALTANIQKAIALDPKDFVLPDGRLDLDHLIRRFTTFWTQQGEILAMQEEYQEAAPQLLLQGWLQVSINGHGFVDREYGLGRRRIDLLVRWPYINAEGKRDWQHEALELKDWAKGEADPLDEGLEQIDRYLSKLGLGTGVLAIFNRRHPGAPLEQRVSLDKITSPAGRTITLLRA